MHVTKLGGLALCALLSACASAATPASPQAGAVNLAEFAGKICYGQYPEWQGRVYPYAWTIASDGAVTYKDLPHSDMSLKDIAAALTTQNYLWHATPVGNGIIFKRPHVNITFTASPTPHENVWRMRRDYLTRGAPERVLYTVYSNATCVPAPPLK